MVCGDVLPPCDFRVKAKLQEQNPDRVEAFMTGAQGEVKKIIGNLKNFQVSGHHSVQSSPSA